MELQKTRARASWVGAQEEVAEVYRKAGDMFEKTEFLGYETMKADCVVNALIEYRSLVEEVNEGEELEILLDRSPFYGESGGQVGDIGVIKSERMKIEVRDTKKINNLLVHFGKVVKGTVRRGMSVQVFVDEERRQSIKRNHTATHLLHAALKQVLGDHIKQAGSLVAPDRLRFDFNHFFGMEEKEIGEVEEIVNEKVFENLPVDVAEKPLDEAISGGAVALFGEKYGERVRVVRTGDFTAELCGGTHCRATGDIGPFKIVSEGSVAAGIRRIEAITGHATFQYNSVRENELKKAAGLLKVSELNVSGRIEKLVHDLKQNEKKLDRFKQKSLTKNIEAILENVVNVKDIKVLAFKSDGVDMKALRSLADSLKDKMGSGVIVLGSALDGQAYYVSVVTKELVSRLNAGEILKAVTGGRGGGRPDMAQGGTKDPDGLDKAISSVNETIQKMIQ
jgi:alanyl-tRNA synthetase